MSESFVITIWAKPGASKTAVLGWRLGANTLPELLVAVAVIPEAGKANKAIRSCMAYWLNVPVQCVNLVAGQTSRRKQWTVELPQSLTMQERQAVLQKLTPNL